MVTITRIRYGQKKFWVLKFNFPMIIIIDNLALFALLGEPFVETGLAIKKISKFKPTFIIGLANDYIGYIPTENAFKEGGYTTRPARWSKLVPEAEKMIVDKAEELLKKI